MGGQQAGAASAQGAQRANLALIYQEILTAITRFRSNRQAVSDAATFRNQIKGAIGSAEAEATRAGFPTEDVRLATFAVVALIDESILNSNNPLFADWPRMPLQEELFGVHTAGEMFFQCIDRLLAKSDAPHAVDVLEIYDLCLLLGYRGKFSLSGAESLRAIAASVTEKLQRLRGGPRPLAPHWAPPDDVVQQEASDPWVRALMVGTLGALLVAVLFFVGFKFVLISGASGLHSIALPH